MSWAGLDDGDAEKDDGSSCTLTIINANNIGLQCQKVAGVRGTHGILVSNPVQPETIQYETVRSTARSYKYLDALTTSFVVILLVSNLVAQKVCLIGPVSIGGWSIGPFAVSGAVLLFPITYIFGDVFTEVYGYAASRRAIWLGFFGTALLYIIGAWPPAMPSKSATR